jgi:hypothetical protein
MALVGIPNFEFRVPPRPNNRAGRYKIGATPLRIGVPVKVVDDAELDAQGRLELELVTGNVGKPIAGIHGLMVFEPAFSYAFQGRDRRLDTPSDLVEAPANAAVQLVNGDDVKITLRNTDEQNFLGGRLYPAATYVAGLGATPTLGVGDFVGPGAGDIDDGFWAATNEANAWFAVVGVDAARQEADLRMLF